MYESMLFELTSDSRPQMRSRMISRGTTMPMFCASKSKIWNSRGESWMTLSFFLRTFAVRFRVNSPTSTTSCWIFCVLRRPSARSRAMSSANSNGLTR